MLPVFFRKRLMMLSSLALSAFALWSPDVFAEQTYSGKEIGGPSSAWTASDSSEANRQNSHWSLFLAAGGSTSFGLSYSINPDNNLELSYRYDEYEGSTFAARNTQVRDINLSYRRFLGSTFVLGATLAQRELFLDGEEWWGNQNSNVARYYHYSSYTRDRVEYVGKISIGNQWQWKHFQAGVDWITFEQRIMKQSDIFQSYQAFNPTTDAEKAMMARAEAHSASLNHGFPKSLYSISPVFRLGWSF